MEVSREGYLNSIVISLSVMHNNNPLKFKSLKKCQNAFSSPTYYYDLIWVCLLENRGISGSFKREDGLTLYNVRIVKHIHSAKTAPPVEHVSPGCTLEVTTSRLSLSSQVNIGNLHYH